MPTIEERVAFLEGQMAEQSHVLVDIREAIRQFESRVDARFDSTERRFDGVDRRLEAIDRRFEAIDHRFETVDRRSNALDDKVSRQFVWLVGIQITTLVAIVGALLARA